MELLKKIIDWTLNVILIGFALVATWLLLQIFVFTSFRIPTDSMEPTLVEGDAVLVNKLVLGARIFNLNGAIRGERVKIHRMPAIRRVKREDVLVFHFPHPHTWKRVEMHIMKYYIKRCIAIPGDTLTIRQGLFSINSSEERVGNCEAQQQIGKLQPTDFPEGIYNAFPFDAAFGWNIQTFGPLYVPKKGDKLKIDASNYLLYRKLIEWEQNKPTELTEEGICINGSVQEYYCFESNYYFVAGDKAINSQDSRYWGLLPEEYIVGKASII